MPDSVEMPAPVSATMRCDRSTHSRTVSMFSFIRNSFYKNQLKLNHGVTETRRKLLLPWKILERPFWQMKRIRLLSYFALCFSWCSSWLVHHSKFLFQSLSVLLRGLGVWGWFCLPYPRFFSVQTPRLRASAVKIFQKPKIFSSKFNPATLDLESTTGYSFVGVSSSNTVWRVPYAAYPPSAVTCPCRWFHPLFYSNLVTVRRRALVGQDWHRS